MPLLIFVSYKQIWEPDLATTTARLLYWGNVDTLSPCSVPPWAALCMVAMVSLIAKAKYLFLVSGFCLAEFQRSFGYG